MGTMGKKKATIIDGNTQDGSQYIISVEKGKFFRAVLSPDRCHYRRVGEHTWHSLACGCIIYRWPGDCEIYENCAAEFEKRLSNYEREIKEMKSIEMLRRIEMKYPLRAWLAGDTGEHRGGKCNVKTKITKNKK